MVYVYSGALLVLGILMIGKPEALWKIENFLFTKGGGPSELYLAISRVLGVLFIIAAVVMFIVSFV